MNRYTTKSVKEEIPFEACSRIKTSVSHLRVFGCIAYAHVPKELRNKLDNMLGPYTTHATPILLQCAPYKPTTIIVVPLH